MTDPTDANYQPPPLDGADDSAPQLSSTDADASQPLNEVNDTAPPESSTDNTDATGEQPPEQVDADAADSDTTDGANPVGDVAKGEGERDGPGEPEDYAALSADEIDRDLGALKRLDDSLSRQAWIYRMQTFPRVRALKDKVGGTKFEAICKRQLKLNKTYAYQIISRLYREPHIVREIWDRVIAESHAAAIRGDDYEYPTTKTMLSWYKPPDENEPADKGKPEDNTGDNDPRSRGQIIKDEIKLRGELETLTHDFVRERAARTELTRDYDIVSKQATERKHDLDLLRESASTERQAAKAEIDARDRMIAEQRQALADDRHKAHVAITDRDRMIEQQKRDADVALAAVLAEIVRLKTLVPTSGNGDGDDGGPDDGGGEAISDLGGEDGDGVETPSHAADPVEQPPEPEPPKESVEPQAKRIADMTLATEDNAIKWGGKATLTGGTRMGDRLVIAKTRRLCAYALLDYLPVEEGFAAAEKLNPITSPKFFFEQITPEMTPPELVALLIPKTTTAKE